MLKKKERLTKKEFDRFFSIGKRYHGNTVQLIYAPQDEGKFNGAAVVGKKVYKGAVDRNRLRRRIYAVLYKVKQENKLTGVYILIAKPLAKTTPFLQIREEIIALIGKTQKAG